LGSLAERELHAGNEAPSEAPMIDPTSRALFRSSPSRRGLLVRAVLALLGATLFPAAARAQSPQPGGLDRARELFVEATAQRDAGDARGSLEKFKAAHDLATNPVTTLELGRTYAMLGMILEAREAFLSTARIPIQPDETTRATQARQDAARLAADAQEQIDRIVASAPTVASAPVVASPPLQTGDTRPASSTSLIVAPAPTSPFRAESTGIGAIAYIGFGVGVAGFAAGSVLAVMALSKASDAQDACSGDTSGACKQAATDDLQTARSLGYSSITLFGIAGLGIVVGIVNLLTDPPGAKETRTSSIRVAPWIGAGAGGLRGSF
jgi:hypothetical protein